jgi:sortase (surface protein transpeptidase)
VAQPTSQAARYNSSWQSVPHAAEPVAQSFSLSDAKLAAKATQTLKKVKLKKYHFSLTLPYIDSRRLDFLGEFSPPQTRFVMLLVVALTVSVGYNLKSDAAKSGVNSKATVATTQSATPESQTAATAAPIASSTSQQPATPVVTSASSNVVLDTPQTLTISKINVNANVETVSSNASGLISSPSNDLAAGWYNASSKPGAAGAVLINGSAAPGGVFAKLNALAVGDLVKVKRSDGQTFSYKVVKIQPLAAGDPLDMTDLLSSEQPATPGLNLVSNASGSAGRIVVKAVEYTNG